MTRHILAPLSVSDEGLDGLRFAAQLFTRKKTLRVTLFHVIAAPHLHPSDAATKSELARVLRQEKALREKAERVLREAAEYLREAGFSRENVDAQIARRKYGAAGDIAEKCAKGRYDAVSMGHGGLTFLDAFVRRSVGGELVKTPLGAPLWISRWPDPGAKHALVCVDGSVESLRAADHAAFMLRDEPGHEIHLLHIHDPAREEPLDAEADIEAARRIVLENGVDAARIRTIVKRGAGVARMIRIMASQGGYAVAAVGRQGAGAPPGRGFFTGSVARALLCGLEGRSLWVVS